MVCLSVTLVSPAKTAEPIEVSFGMCSQVGSRNHALDGVQIPTGEGVSLREKWRPIVKYADSAVSCAKTAEPIEMQFGTLSRSGTMHYTDSAVSTTSLAATCKGTLHRVSKKRPNFGLL